MEKALIPLKLPPLSDPKFVERFRQTKNQNFITHFYECFKTLNLLDKTVHNNAKDMLKIIIQQRKEFMDKLSSTTEAMTEMEEKLKKLNKENEEKKAKLEEEQSKNGTIMIHLNGLNQKYDQLEKLKADLTEKLSESEKTVQKWVHSALEDHNEVIEIKAKNEELQKEFEKEKENLKKILDENANSAQKEINELIQKNKKMDLELLNLKKEHEKCEAVQKNIPKSRKRVHKDFQIGLNNLPSTSMANPPPCIITTPPELPSLTPPKNPFHSQESLQDLQNYIFHQQNNFQFSSNQSSAINGMPSNNQQQQNVNQNNNNNSSMLMKINHGSTVPPLEQQQQQQHYFPRLGPNESLMAGNNQQISSAAPFCCFPFPQNIHHQQQQLLQQQQQIHMQSQINDEQQQIQSKSSNLQVQQQQHHQQQQQQQQQQQTTVNQQQQIAFQQQNGPHFIHPSNILMGQIPYNSISQQRIIQQQQKQVQSGHPLPYPSAPVHSSTPSGPQPLSNDTLSEFNKYFNSLPFDQRRQILNAAGVTVIPPVVEISD